MGLGTEDWPALPMATTSRWKTRGRALLTTSVSGDPSLQVQGAFSLPIRLPGGTSPGCWGPYMDVCPRAGSEPPPKGSDTGQADASTPGRECLRARPWSSFVTTPRSRVAGLPVGRHGGWGGPGTCPAPPQPLTARPLHTPHVPASRRRMPHSLDQPNSGGRRATSPSRRMVLGQIHHCLPHPHPTAGASSLFSP